MVDEVAFVGLEPQEIHGRAEGGRGLHPLHARAQGKHPAICGTDHEAEQKHAHAGEAKPSSLREPGTHRARSEQLRPQASPEQGHDGKEERQESLRAEPGGEQHTTHQQQRQAGRRQTPRGREEPQHACDRRQEDRKAAEKLVGASRNELRAEQRRWDLASQPDAARNLDRLVPDHGQVVGKVRMQQARRRGSGQRCAERLPRKRLASQERGPAGGQRHDRQQQERRVRQRVQRTDREQRRPATLEDQRHLRNQEDDPQ